MKSFKEWLKEVIDSGPFEPATPQDRRPDLIKGGIDDGTPKPMKKSVIPSAFPTYGGKPLPGNKKP